MSIVDRSTNTNSHENVEPNCYEINSKQLRAHDGREPMRWRHFNEKSNSLLSDATTPFAPQRSITRNHDKNDSDLFQGDSDDFSIKLKFIVPDLRFETCKRNQDRLRQHRQPVASRLRGFFWLKLIFELRNFHSFLQRFCQLVITVSEINWIVSQ